MKNNILMNFDEPTDIQLVQLMSEVATEAKSKASIEKKHLSEKITCEIAVVKAQMKANRK
jgi:hypothetical protein